MDLPSGTVTFLFTDIEGSTRLLHELGDAYADELAEHRRVLREVFASHGGVEVDTQGDAFFVAFARASDALAAAREVQSALDGPIRVRVGIHTGEPLVTEEGYVGIDVHRAARIAAVGHGGQVLISQSTRELIGAESLRDLGEHRLKDLTAPERIYQLGDGQFPPLKSLHQTNLPVPTTPFVGREKELAEVIGLLSCEEVRLLTLTGPGGTGKTRLGAQAAGALAERYRHGVWWIPLAPLRDPALVVETAAQAIGAKEGLAEHIGDKAMLLLFDNFEHLLDAAGDVAAVLECCSNVEVLVTSREPLHISGEQEYAVPPFVHEEGVGFFLARARAIEWSFEPDEAVSEICRRLDDLPLALELAAARVKALSTKQILERLEQRLPLLTGGARDLPERQRTLRATIEWSYDLLTSEEQQLFGRLSVFRGGWTLEAAEQIAGASIDTLQSLVDKSLVRHTRGRYWMLETIHDYASDRAETTGERDELRNHHAAFFLAVAEDAEPHVLAARRERIDLLDDDHDNLRAALDWFQATAAAEPALRLAGALARFWLMRGYGQEGSRRLEAALALDDGTLAARAKALTGSAMHLTNLTLGGDPAIARARASEALEANKQLGDQLGIAAAEWVMGSVGAAEDMAESRDFWESSLNRSLACDAEQFALIVRRHLAWAYDALGERERCIAMHEENLQHARALGNDRMAAITLGAIASYRIEEGRLDEAVDLLKESHQLLVAAADPMQSAFDVFRFSAAVAAKGNAEVAATILAAADALTDALSLNLNAWDPAYVEFVRRMIRSRIDEPTFRAAWERGRSLSAHEAVELALAALDA
jgi:predicted ATPase